MNPKNETGRVRAAKARYFFTAMAIYTAVYLILALLLKVLQIIFLFSPMAELIVLVILFFVSAWLTKRLIRLNAVRNFMKP